MGRQISVGECMDLYRTARTSVWRWEQMSAYSVPDEVEPMRRWRAGESDDLAWLQGWLDQVREAVSAGVAFHRVRRVDVPPTDYQRWVNSIAWANTAAGELIRYLSGTPTELGMPSYDFLLIDDTYVAEMDFSGGSLRSAILHDDIAVVERHRAWRDWAWDHASPAYEVDQRSP